MYGINKEKKLTETHLDHLSGYENSRPVRIGNAWGSLGELENAIFQVSISTVKSKWLRSTSLGDEGFNPLPNCICCMFSMSFPSVCNTGDIHINGLEGPYTFVLIDGMPIVSCRKNWQIQKQIRQVQKINWA